MDLTHFLITPFRPTAQQLVSPNPHWFVRRDALNHHISSPSSCPFGTRRPFPRSLIACLLIASGLSIPAQAAVLYWDTDGSGTGNNTTTGANLGGAGPWNMTDANWWNAGAGVLQAWTNGSDVMFWGTAGPVTVTTVSANSLAFKSTGYSINSGTLTVAGAASSFNVDAGVTAVIDSPIAGSNTLVKLGPGTLVLSNPANLNTATTSAGGWRIEGGTVRIAGDGSLGAPLPDSARNSITDIQLNQGTIQADASFDLSINRRTKINTGSTTNRGDGIIDTHGHVVRWFGSLQGGPGSLQVINSGSAPGLLILGTDKIANINPFGSSLPAGAVNLTIQGGAIVQTSGTVTPTNGELGSETNTAGAALAIKLDDGQIRSESGGYFFYRHLIVGPGIGSLDTGAWDQTFIATVSGTGMLSKEGTGVLTLDNTSATWTGGTRIRSGTLQLGRRGSNGLLPGTLANPSPVVISSGATLKFNRGSDKTFYDNISGAGGVTVANTPTSVVRLVSDNTYAGPTTISSGSLMIGQGNPGQPGSIASSIVNNSGTLVFNRVEDLSYGGAIGGSGAVTKQAAGRLTLTGTHTYTGSTTIGAGTLLVNGALGNTPVTVTGGTLGGNGIIRGALTVQPAGRLSPGTTIGTLSISNSVNLFGSTIMDLNPVTGAHDRVSGMTTITYGGTLVLSNLAGAAMTASNTFKLFSATSYRGAFTSFLPAIPGPGLAWNTNSLTTDGTLRVVAISPVEISNVALGNQLFLSWLEDHTGWRLQSQTNLLSVGLGTNWVDVPGSRTTNQMTFPIDWNVGGGFFRLVFP